MNSYEKHMWVAISLSTGVLILNIFAVTSGMTDGYYAQVTQWIEPYFRTSF